MKDKIKTDKDRFIKSKLSLSANGIGVAINYDDKWYYCQIVAGELRILSVSNNIPTDKIKYIICREKPKKSIMPKNALWICSSTNKPSYVPLYDREFVYYQKGVCDDTCVILNIEGLVHTCSSKMESMTNVLNRQT